MSGGASRRTGRPPVVRVVGMLGGGTFVGRMTRDMIYTYAHRRGDSGDVFYIGKGRAHRAWDRSGRSAYWNNVVAKHGVVIEIAGLFDTDADAYQHEVELISQARAAGISLVNLTIGGDGVTGHERTAEHSAKIAASTAAWRATAAGQAAARAASTRAKAQMADEAFAHKIAASRDAHFADRTNRQAVGERMREYYADPTNLAAHSARLRARMTPKRLAQMSALNGGRPFVHLETGDTYQTQGDASRALGISQSAISNVLHGHRPSVRNQRFAYV